MEAKAIRAEAVNPGRVKNVSESARVLHPTGKDEAEAAVPRTNAGVNDPSEAEMIIMTIKVHHGRQNTSRREPRSTILTVSNL